MQSDRASRTAEYVAFFRALESARPAGARLFDDPYAPRFLRPGLRIAARLACWPPVGALVAGYADRRIPGARTSAIARTRVIDDALRGALRRGTDQVVLLGAGFDARAYRLPECTTATVFEVDHPATGAQKLACLRRMLPEVPAHVRFVATDFNRESLPDVLARAGFDPRRAAVFVWEGVTNYLTGDAVDAVLRFVAGCGSGTRLIFTYVHRGVLDGSVAFDDGPAIRRDVAALSEPWTFGLDPAELPAYLQARGLALEYDAGARDYRRQGFGPAADAMTGYDFYRVAIARVPATSGGAVA